MNREQFEILGQRFIDIGEEMKAILAAAPVPNKQVTDGVRLLDDSPSHMCDLPAFFGGITSEQLKASWVQCVVSCATENEYSVRDLNMALLAVKLHPHGPMIEFSDLRRVQKKQARSPIVHSAQSTSATDGPRRRRKHDRGDVLEKLLSLAPNVGDQIVLVDHFDAALRLVAREVASGSGLFNLSKLKRTSSPMPAVMLERNHMSIEASPFAEMLRKTDSAAPTASTNDS